MITDNKTNKVFLADCLIKKHPSFYQQFCSVLSSLEIGVELLPHTRDIWAVDYMPVQITKDKFIQFTYNPDYLRSTIKHQKTISDVDKISEAINLKSEKSNIILDGGNVTRLKDKVILCDKVFKENPYYSTRELINELEELFEVDKVVFIPTDPDDIFGHADGLVRAYDDDTVLISEPDSYRDAKCDKAFALQLQLSLNNAAIKHIPIPYNPYHNKKAIHANGIYLNYLQMQQGIVLPTFGIAEDEKAVRCFEELFPGEYIQTIDSNVIAEQGGVLNCISWNVEV